MSAAASAVNSAAATGVTSGPAMNIDTSNLLAPRASKGAIDKTAKDFEAVFLSQMLSHMFEGVGQDSLVGDKESEEIYRSWMMDQYGRLIANSGGVGVAGYVKNELLRQQEVAAGQPTGSTTLPVKNP